MGRLAAVYAIAVILLLILLWLALNSAYAADKYVCALWARAQVMIDFSTTNDVDLLTAGPGMIELRLGDTYNSCLIETKPRPPLTGQMKTDIYIAGIQAILAARISKVGTVPATIGDEQWREECRLEYKSWDEETGTVVRYGASERVRCPCGKEVQCGPQQ